MTDSAIVYTQAEDDTVAADELAKQVSAAFAGQAPDALILFASPRYDHPVLLKALAASLGPHALVGASSVSSQAKHGATGRAQWRSAPPA
jgi:small ligand-binding sensory domain FIST